MKVGERMFEGKPQTLVLPGPFVGDVEDNAMTHGCRVIHWYNVAAFGDEIAPEYKERVHQVRACGASAVEKMM